MKCNEARNLIATDLIDKEISAGKGSELAGHLAGCASCRAYEQAVVKAAVEPFKSARRASPPETIWYNIKRSITENTSKKETFASQWLTFPRVFFTMASLSCFILAVVLYLNRQPAVMQEASTPAAPQAVEMASDIPSEQNEDYFSYVYEGFEENTESSGENGKSLGTAAEELLFGKSERNFLRLAFV